MKKFVVSNPISGEVGAAAVRQSPAPGLRAGFKPHQRGGGCCSRPQVCAFHDDGHLRFKPHQRGGGCCSPRGSEESLQHQP